MQFPADYQNSCRLCLSRNGRHLPIFNPTDDGLEPLNVRISACLAIEVSEHDDFPKQICHRCECQMNIWHYFKLECDLSQQKLRKWHRVLSNTSTHSDNLETVLDIKLEPEDDEQYLDGPNERFLDVRSTQNTHDASPVEDPDSSNDSMAFEEECDSEPIASESIQNSLNLVISGTSSVAAEFRIQTEDKQTLAEEELHNKIVSDVVTDITVVDKNSSNAVDSGEACVSPHRMRSEMCHVPEGDANTANDLTSDLQSNFSQDAPFSPEFVELDSDIETPGIGVSGGFKDPLSEGKEESGEPVQAFYKIKEEPMEGVEDHLQSPLRNPCNIEQNVSFITSTVMQTSALDIPPSISSSPITSQQNKFKRKKIVKSLSLKRKASSVLKNGDLNSTKQSGTQCGSDQVYNYSSVDLPAISNDLFDEETKYCKLCGKTFQSLWSHMKTVHTQENPFTCAVCLKIFTGRRELVTHRVRTISKYCRAGKEPDDNVSEEIIIHTDIPYGIKGRFECRKCKEVFVQLSVAKSHARLHTGERPFFCYKCNEKEFRVRKSALAHVAVCGKRRLNPPIDSKGNSSILVSILRNKVVKPVIEKGHKCSQCGRVFSNNGAYSNHIRVECVRRCFSCSKYVPKKTYHKHYRWCLKATHHPSVNVGLGEVSTSSESSENIKSTNVQFATSMDTNRQESNSDLQPLIPRKNAPITEIVDLPVKDLVRMHLDSNGKLQSMICKLCNRTMKSRKTLYAHLLKHSSRAFRCEVCSMRMCLRSTYEAHMSNLHKGYLDAKEKNLDPNEISSTSLMEKETNNMAEKKPSVKFTGFKIAKLKCEICSKLFSSATSLKFHKQSHKKIKCNRCEITFPATMEKSHICTPKVKIEPSLSEGKQTNLLSPEKRAVIYTCKLCQKQFHTKKMLYQHKKMHIKMKIYKCQMCDNSYSDAEALRNHKDTAHGPEPALSLNINDGPKLESDAEIPPILPVSETIKSHGLKCPVCHKDYSNRNSLKKHMKLHLSRTQQPVKDSKPPLKPLESSLYHCNLCEKSYRNKKSLSRHKGLHVREKLAKLNDSVLTSEKEESFKEWSSTSNAPLLSDVSFNCNICLKKFSSLKNLKLHMFHHEKNILRSSQLHKSEEISPSSETLLESNTQHSCKICSKTFSDQSSFDQHMKTHSVSSVNAVAVANNPKQELLKCQLCSKEYRCRQNFKYHMMGHSGEKPYKCRSCSNKYSNPKALAKHEKERHTLALRPFCCNRCKTSFILKEDLLAHHEKCSH